MESICFEACARISALTRDKKKGKTNGEQIFANSNDEVFNVQIGYQTSPEFVAEKSADNAACSTEKGAGN